MLDCPVRDRYGRCRGFAEFIYASLLRNGIHHRYDIEAALQYVIEKMLMDRSDTAGPSRATLFGGFTERPDYVDGNPLLARFLSYLESAVRNIRKGRIPRLSNSRQGGLVSIGQGRARKGERTADVSPDELPGRADHDADVSEMVEDIASLLRRKEGAYPIPLVALFRAMLTGMTVDQQRRRFGDRPTRAGRQVIVRTIEEYARSSGQDYLLHLVRKWTAPEDEKPAAPKRAERRPALSDEERDYRSIAGVIARFDRPVGTADLGRYRRRWLDYPPRSQPSPHRNRLEEVLEKMVKDGVLKATRTKQGANLYSPGPEFSRYSE
jgi:hypothetical protein